MAALIGQNFGGVIAILLLSFLVDAFLFKNDHPSARAMKTAAFALVVAAVIAGFGQANGGPFVWTAGVFYIPGALLVFFWFKSRYVAKWSVDEEGDLESTD